MKCHHHGPEAIRLGTSNHRGASSRLRRPDPQVRNHRQQLAAGVKLGVVCSKSHSIEMCWLNIEEPSGTEVLFKDLISSEPVCRTAAFHKIESTNQNKGLVSRLWPKPDDHLLSACVCALAAVAAAQSAPSAPDRSARVREGRKTVTCDAALSSSRHSPWGDGPLLFQRCAPS